MEFSSSFRRGTVLAACLPFVAFGTMACGTSSGGEAAPTTGATTTTTAATTTTTRPLPTADDMKGWTLTVADLPPGWSAESAKSGSGSATEPSAGGEQEDDFLCPAARPQIDEEDSDSVEAQFTQSDSGPYFLQSIEADEDAEAEFAKVERAFKECVGQQWQSGTGDDAMDVTLAPMSVPKVGDQAAAFRSTGRSTSAPVTLTTDFYLVRRDRVLQLYLAMNIVSPVIATVPLSGDDAAALVTAGDEKIADHVGRRVAA